MIENLMGLGFWYSWRLVVIFWTFVLLDELTCGGGLWADVLCI